MLLKGNETKYKKESGVLMHISSLPSKHGIGDLGEEAYRFVDFLKSSRQTYWQLLPLCPVGKGNSPYSSYSAFAGEILFIDLNGLVKDGLLSHDEIPEENFPKNTDCPTLKSALKISTPSRFYSTKSPSTFSLRNILSLKNTPRRTA